MKTIIFKNEKKAKSYEIIASVDFHIYRKGELIRKVCTDKIDMLLENYEANQVTVKQIN